MFLFNNGIREYKLGKGLDCFCGLEGKGFFGVCF